MTKFKLLDRAAGRTILLIPGWASDYRIFNSLNLNANYLLPATFSSGDFEDSLVNAMDDNGIERISIVVWSMGAFLASDFLSKHDDRIADITLVSARKSYEKSRIDEIASQLKKNKTAFLYKFYSGCFCAKERNELGAFKKGIMKRYLDEMSLETLLEGLDYLAQSRITPDALKKAKVKFIHGKEDTVAPIEEVLAMKSELPDAGLVVMEGTGHMPFLKKEFERSFNG